jgi:hypothetical protein
MTYSRKPPGRLIGTDPGFGYPNQGFSKNFKRIQVKIIDLGVPIQDLRRNQGFVKNLEVLQVLAGDAYP